MVIIIICSLQGEARRRLFRVMAHRQMQSEDLKPADPVLMELWNELERPTPRSRDQSMAEFITSPDTYLEQEPDVETRSRGEWEDSPMLEPRRAPAPAPMRHTSAIFSTGVAPPDPEPRHSAPPLYNASIKERLDAAKYHSAPVRRAKYDERSPKTPGTGPESEDPLLNAFPPDVANRVSYTPGGTRRDPRVSMLNGNVAKEQPCCNACHVM